MGETGGGGGGGSRGGGGGTRPYSSSSSRNSSCSGEDCNNSVGLVLGVILAVAAVWGALCCCYYINRRQNNKEAASPSKASSNLSKYKLSPSNQSFEDRVATERSDQAASFSGFRSHDPKSGTYEYKYKQNRKTKEGTVVLYFTEDNGRYKLSGSTLDEDGVANVDEGFATHDGKAWWKETNVTDDESGLQVLNKGQFDFFNCTFEGEWWANTGRSGTFLSFVLQQEEAEDTSMSSAPPETAVRGAKVPFSMALLWTSYGPVSELWMEELCHFTGAVVTFCNFTFS